MDKEKQNILGLEEKDFALYMAYLIWNQHKEIQEHMQIANPTGKQIGKKGWDNWDKHFKVHLCNINPSKVLMAVIKHYFPKMYQEQGKSINQHYEEAEEYIKQKLNRSEGNSSTG